MYILIFFLVISITQFVNNKLMDLSDDSEDAYNFEKKDSLIIAGLFLLGIILQITSKFSFFITFYWFICISYFLACFITIVILLQFKKNSILKKREEMKQVYEILQKLVDKKGEGLDFNNPPFTLNYKYGNIQQITVFVEPTIFGTDPEKVIMPFIPQLNAFLPTYNWSYELHLDQRYIDFIGNDKPPTMARWPGSWLRHFRYMPMGLSGKGEIAYQPDSVPKNKFGRSMFLNEHGDPVDTDKSLPTQPQGLICGAPLGLDTIIPTTEGYKTMNTIKVGEYVFDINNKPVKVIGKSEINYIPDKVYKLIFKKNDETLEIISDSIHKFPKLKNKNLELVKAEKLKLNDIVIDKNIYQNDNYIGWSLINKIEIPKEPVQCILVDSPSHLFLITDETNKNWKGGAAYPYKSIYTRNTGGGKSVAVQNVLLHCLEHRNKIALGLIDPKQVEFSAYKGMNGIVGVATSTLESVELLRIARQVMLKRNKEMANLGIKSLTDYQPSKRSGKCFITGREFNDSDILNVKVENEEKNISCEEFIDYLQENPDKVAEVRLNEKDWITVNCNCCEYIFEDEFPILLIICDELAELTQKSGLKSAQGKEEDALKDEIISIIQSITQLGRSAGVLMLLCTQKPNATIVPTVIRSNTGFRCFCGRAAESGASLVALDNNLATTIDNTYPGAGIIQSAGVPAFVRYYFSKFDDLYDYYEKRGLDSLGYDPNNQEEEEVLQTLEGTEELTMSEEKVKFEFADEKIEIDKREDQQFEEI